MEQQLIERWNGSTNDAQTMGELNAIAQQCANLQSDGCKLYSLTTSYKSKLGLGHTTELVNLYFNDAYFHRFLPKHLFRDKRWIFKCKEKQPYVYSFLENHQDAPDQVRTPTNKMELVFPRRYHHHALIVVLPEHVEVMERFIGVNTFVPVHESIKTSEVKAANLDWLGYAGKKLREYREDFRIFAPTNDSLLYATSVLKTNDHDCCLMKSTAV